MIAAIEATGWSIIIGAVFLGFTQLLTLVLAYRRDAVKAARDAEAATRVEAVRVQAAVNAKKVDEVRETLEKTNEGANKKLDAIHTLTNSSMGRQLQIAALLSQRIASLTGKPEDKLAADEADKLLKDHEIKQAAVDSKADAFPAN